MIALPKSAEWISPEEYLDGERLAEVRHELVEGCVYAMAGASDDHNRITRNILTALDNALQGKPCEPFATDMKVKIPPALADIYYYPDVLVACDPTDNAKYFREKPSVIFEVISPDTERVDRREKAIVYRAIPTLTAYVIVEQERMALTAFRRLDAGWRAEIIEGADGLLKLPSISVEISLNRIYARTSVAKSDS